MSENPYQAPLHPSPGSPSDAFQLHRLKGIAESQRGVMLCVLAQIVIFAGMRFFPSAPAWTVGLAYILVSIAALFYVVQLAYRTRGTGWAVAVGILSLVPLLGLLMMLLASGWATKELRGAGFRVGLLGGNPKEVQKAIDEGAGGA